MKATQIILAVIGLAAAAVATATTVNVIDVPANLHDYVQYGSDAVAALAILGAVGLFFRRKPAPAVAATAWTEKPAAEARRALARPLGSPGSGRMSSEEMEPLREAVANTPVPGGARLTVASSLQGAKSTGGAVLPRAASQPVKAPVDENKQVVYETSDRDDGTVMVIVAAGPKVKGNSGRWHDHIWQPKLKPIKNVEWQPKRNGDGKLKVRGIVSKENLAGVIEAIEKIG